MNVEANEARLIEIRKRFGQLREAIHCNAQGPTAAGHPELQAEWDALLREHTELQVGMTTQRSLL